MYKKDTKSEEMFLYIFWIVPNSWHFATNPGNVYQDTKLIGNVPITLFKMLGNVPLHFTKCKEIFHYTFQFVPNLSNYTTNPRNVPKGYKIDK